MPQGYVTDRPDTALEWLPTGRSTLPASLRAAVRRVARTTASLAAAWRAPILSDAARGRPVSRDPGNLPELHGAARVEAAPWWEVDLGEDRPIYAIRVQSRGGRFTQYDAHLIISISSDRKVWRLVHAGLHYLSSDEAPALLDLRLLDACRARYVRVELPRQGMLRPRRIQVMVRRDRRARLVRRLRRTVTWLSTQRARLDSGRSGPELVDLAINGTLSRREPCAGRPCWVLDLKSVWPIYWLRIHSRRAPDSTAATRAAVAISTDGANWEQIYECVRVFGHPTAPEPLELRLLSMRSARFVRLELPDTVAPLDQIEVLVDRRLVVLGATCARYGFAYQQMLPNMLHRPGHLHYWVENAPDPFDGRIDALHATRIVGRFGNHLKTILHMATLARRIGVPRVYLPVLNQFEIEEPIEADGVTLLPERLLNKEHEGTLLNGSFYFRGAFGRPFEGIAEDDFNWALHKFARPIFNRTAQAPSFVPDEADLAIHIRSGDVFSTRPHPGYVQPPLSYYQLIVRHASSALGVRRVILVYEDERNPCIAALRTWLSEIGLPCVTHSTSLTEDIAVLLHARYCAFGHGTFGQAILRLSDRMRAAFFPWTSVNSPPIARSVGIRPIVVRDRAGGYTKVGMWCGSPDQRRMMLDYPIENLALDEQPMEPSLPPGSPNEGHV